MDTLNYLSEFMKMQVLATVLVKKFILPVLPKGYALAEYICDFVSWFNIRYSPANSVADLMVCMDKDGKDRRNGKDIIPEDKFYPAINSVTPPLLKYRQDLGEYGNEIKSIHVYIKPPAKVDAVIDLYDDDED